MRYLVLYFYWFWSGRAERRDDLINGLIIGLMLMRMYMFSRVDRILSGFIKCDPFLSTFD